MTDQKPNDFLASFGPEVETSSESLPPSEALREKLRELGKRVGEGELKNGKQYVGSFATHIYLDTNDTLKTRYEINTITQNALDSDVNEKVASLAMDNTIINLRRGFHPNYKKNRLDNR